MRGARQYFFNMHVLLLGHPGPYGRESQGQVHPPLMGPLEKRNRWTCEKPQAPLPQAPEGSGPQEVGPAPRAPHGRDVSPHRWLRPQHSQQSGGAASGGRAGERRGEVPEGEAQRSAEGPVGVSLSRQTALPSSRKASSHPSHSVLDRSPPEAAPAPNPSTGG